MKFFLLMILLPVVSFLFTYVMECLFDHKNPLKVKENGINFIFGGAAGLGILALALLAYMRSGA